MKLLLITLLLFSFCYSRLLWNHHDDTAIYERVKLVNMDHTVASTMINPPPSVQYFNDRSGTPLWSLGQTPPSNGNENHDAAGSLFGNKLAVAEHFEDYSNTSNNYVTLSVYTVQGDSTTAPTPDWTYRVESATLLQYHAVEMTMRDDEVFLFVTMLDSFTPVTYHARIYIFDVATGDVSYQYDAPQGTTAIDMEISLGGEIAMFNDISQFIVVDVKQNKILWQEDFGFGDYYPFSVSIDGRVIAHGITDLKVLERVGDKYELAYTVPGNGEILCATAVSSDSEVVMAVWTNGQFDQKRIDVYTSWDPTPIHSHTLPVHEGNYQDWITGVKLTADGQYALIGSWGQSDNVAPTVILLERGDGIVFSYTTPGSVFDIDIMDDPENGMVYFCSAGKAVHANMNGEGGDVYCFLHEKQ
ncbi:hypothetical protein M0813_06187 [Anaeramoeba flamelloides]|uniref:Uncharacterized protein n=1 Tax=Anaeramoeba flamelloides TaxID=1746091 RepID=A0ABQ8XIH8_9EUKA|nr:hypothetical protein M0813_06187 [Anaeramoeba flamelloides]